MSRWNRIARLGWRLALLAAFVIGPAKPASADWLLTPYLGFLLAGPPNTIDIDTLDESFKERRTFGGAIAATGSGVFGFELDLSYTPSFFRLEEGGSSSDFLAVDSSLTTLMGNLVFAIPIGGSRGVGVHPYVTGGAGLMRADVQFESLFTDISTNDFAINVGGGAHIFFSDAVGIRGDLRYFRGLERSSDEDDLGFLDPGFALEDFDYWRATIGVTFRFGG
jgi:opacity protein-like surface antigen